MAGDAIRFQNRLDVFDKIDRGAARRSMSSQDNGSAENGTAHGVKKSDGIHEKCVTSALSRAPFSSVAASRRDSWVGYYIIDARDTPVNQFPSRQNSVEFEAVLNASGVTKK